MLIVRYYRVDSECRHAMQFGCQLEFVTNKSQEGSQFCRGFGGIGGVLRYSVDLTEFEEAEDLDGVEWDSDSDIW